MGLVDGKVALVTGGGRGIGRATAELLAAEGAAVAVADIDRANAEAVAAGIRERGGRSLALPVDLSDVEQIRPMFERVLGELGRLDILFNNAGVLDTTPIDQLAPEGWDRLMDVNLRGVFFCAQEALRIMRERGGGRIINTASMAAQLGGIVSGANYAAAKAGVACLTKSMAKWGGPHGILVNTINPGVIDTAMTAGFPPDRRAAMIEATPLRRLGTAEEVAKVVLFLASDLASFVTGAHVDINGGLHTD